MAEEEEDKKKSTWGCAKILWIIFIILVLLLIMTIAADATIGFRAFQADPLNPWNSAGGDSGSGGGNVGALSDDCQDVPPELIAYFNAAGAQYNIDPALLVGISKIETDIGRNKNTSSAGAKGVMQFMPYTWAGENNPTPFDTNITTINQYGGYGTDGDGDGIADPLNPADNIYSGAKYMQNLLKNNSLHDALQKYNGSDPNDTSDQTYAKNVMDEYKKYRACLPTGSSYSGSSTIAGMSTDSTELINQIESNKNLQFSKGNSGLLKDLTVPTLQVMERIGEWAQGTNQVVDIGTLTEHNATTSTGNTSLHVSGQAMDISVNPGLQQWLYDNSESLNLYELLGPDTQHWVGNNGKNKYPTTDQTLINQHQNHIHVGVKE